MGYLNCGIHGEYSTTTRDSIVVDFTESLLHSLIRLDGLGQRCAAADACRSLIHDMSDKDDLAFLQL